MHNCVHSCYWKSIVEGRYIIVCGVIQEVKVDVGIRVKPSNILEIDQIHSIYNGNVSEGVSTYCEHWLESNKDELLSRVGFINKNKVTKEDPLNVLPNIVGGAW